MGLGVVFGFEAGLYDLELEGANGSKEGRAGGAEADGKGLDDALLHELVEASAVFLGVGGSGVGEVGEDLGGKARDLVVGDGAVFGESVADAEAVVANEADDVAGEGFVDGLAFLAEEFVGGGEADVAAGALVGDDHVAGELTGAHAKEGDAVAVFGVHIGLDLEDEAGKLVVGDGYFASLGGGG